MARLRDTYADQAAIWPLPSTSARHDVLGSEASLLNGGRARAMVSSQVVCGLTASLGPVPPQQPERLPDRAETFTGGSRVVTTLAGPLGFQAHNAM